MNEETKKILHLPITKEYFDKIVRGEKHTEYREYKLYWITRLMYYGFASKKDRFKNFDEIHFRNGYRKDSPFMRTKHEGTILKKAYFPIKRRQEYCFLIGIGEILETKNYN